MAEFELKPNVSFCADDVSGAIGLIIGEYPFDEYEVPQADKNSVTQEYGQLKTDGGFKVIRLCLKSKVDPGRFFRTYDTLFRVKNLPLPENKLALR